MGPLDKVLRRNLLKLASAGPQSDGALLQQFVAQQDQSAFEEIVRRHGPMVWRVCQRIVHHAQDAEDAFQATFIVLTRKAGAVARMESVGGWLHGVAHRVALRAQTRLSRRQAREKPVDEVTTTSSSAAELDDRAVRRVLNEEIGRLPEKYRCAVVLCYLEGRAVEEAASQLQCPPGTVKSRLFGARDLLRNRLARRGVTLAGTALATLLAQEASATALPQHLMSTTVQGGLLLAAGETREAALFSGAALELAANVLRQASIRRLGWIMTLLLVLGSAGATLAMVMPRSRPPSARALRFAGNTPGMEIQRGTSPFRRAVFSGDNRHLAFNDQAGGVTVYKLDWGIDDLRLTKLPLRLDEPGIIRSCAEFSPDSKTLAVGCLDGTVQVWDPATGSHRSTLRTGYTGEVVKLAFSPDGKSLAAMVGKGGLTTWDLRTERVRSRAEAPEHTGHQVVFTSEGELLAINDQVYRVRCWDAATGQEKLLGFPRLPKPIRPGKPPATNGSVVALTSDGNMIVACNDETIHLWKRPADHLQYLFALENANNVSFKVGPRGDTVMCHFHDNNRVIIWDVASRRILEQFEKPHSGGVLFTAYSPDGTKFLWTGYGDGTKSGQTTGSLVGGVIDLDVRRRELVRATNP